MTCTHQCNIARPDPKFLTGLVYSKKILEQIGKPVDIEGIRPSIPVIQSLHPSFLASKKFLVWQITRLDKDYQVFSKNIWKSIGENLFTFDEWNERLDNDCSRYIERICSDLSLHTEKRGLSISRSNFNTFHIKTLR